MNKAVLVINEPDTCRNCILWHREYYGWNLYIDYCAGIPMAQIHDIDIYHEKPDWCPLIPEPKHDENGDIVWYDPTEPITEETAEKIKAIGWNACIDYLEGKNDG